MALKTALITGASRGIGKAIAVKLAAHGLNLVLLSRTKSDLDAVKSEIETGGASGSVLTLPCDILNVENIKSAVNEAIAKFEQIDLLVCNAGVGKFGNLAETTESDWDQMLNTNAKGSFLLAQQIAPPMVSRGDGQMIFVTSDVAKRTFATGAIYCASKFAQYAFASALRQELRPAGVRVSVIMPGLVASSFNDSDADSPEKATWLKPADVADAVMYIAAAPQHVLIDEITLHPVSQEV